jgi:hypothetical protein
MNGSTDLDETPVLGTGWVKSLCAPTADDDFIQRALVYQYKYTFHTYVKINVGHVSLLKNW